MTSTDNQTFADALIAQTGWLRGLVRSLVRDPDRADDLCQSTLLQAWRHRPSTETELRPWLATVARNLSGRNAKREAMRARREDAAARKRAETAAQDTVERAAWQQTVVAAVMDLAEPYRTTLLMRFWENLPPRKVAQRLNVPVETVRTRVKRGLAMVRESLDRKFGERSIWVTAVLPFAESSVIGAAWTAAAIFVMTKKISLAVAGVLIAIAITTVTISSPSDRPEAMPDAAPAVVVVAEVLPDEVLPESSAIQRMPVDAASTGADAGSYLDDPAILAAMCGFTGRVVDGRQPVGDTGVRLFRFSQASLVRDVSGRFGAGSASPIEHWDAQTNDAGEFHLARVWPRGVFVLEYGRGSENVTRRILDRTPGPGELVALGDLGLEQGGVVVGRAVDRSGAPIQDAEVFVVDVPAATFAAVALDRLSPDSVLLLRSAGLPEVVVLPPWVQQVFDDLPIGRARSDANGDFRVAGVSGGASVLVVRAPGLQPTIRPRVQVVPGRVQDVGSVKLADGEEVWGRVVDEAGEPVAFADVIAAPASIVPVDVGARIGKTDENGEFSAMGFPRGRVSVAARRTSSDVWIVAEPQPIGGEVVVSLPATHVLTVTVTDAATSQALAGVELGLSRGSRRTSTTLQQVGVPLRLDLAGRVESKDGEQRVSGLPAGDYVLTVAVDGYGPVCKSVAVGDDGDSPVGIALRAALQTEIFVSALGEPLRNATVMVSIHPDCDAASNLPSRCGYTDRNGAVRTSVRDVAKIMVVATHPAYGTVDLVADPSMTRIDVIMQAPGSIAGLLTRGGAPVASRKWAVALRRQRDGVLGMMDESPMFGHVDSGGHFQLEGLQPGRYVVAAVPSFGDHISLGRFIQRAGDWAGQGGARCSVEVEAGVAVQANLDLEGEPQSGSGVGSGSIVGRLHIDGQAAAGLRVRAMAYPSLSKHVTTDEHGDFTFTGLPAGDIHLVATRRWGSQQTEIWSRSVRLAALEQRELQIDLRMTRIAGTVVTAAGDPVGGAEIEIFGVPDRDANQSMSGWASLSTSITCDVLGRFDHDELLAGKYGLRAKVESKTRLWSSLHKIEVASGDVLVGIEIVVRPGSTIRGRIDMRRLAADPDAELKVQLHRLDSPAPNTTWMVQVASRELRADGAFEFEGLSPTTYKIVVQAGEDAELAARQIEVGSVAHGDIVFESLPLWGDDR